MAETPTHDDLMRLWRHAQSFVTAQRISCPEAVYQTDRVIENAYEFIDGVGNIVGWYHDPEGDEAPRVTAPDSGREAAVCAPECLRCHCTHPPRQRGRTFAAVCKEHGCDRYQPAPAAPPPAAHYVHVEGTPPNPPTKLTTTNHGGAIPVFAPLGSNGFACCGGVTGHNAWCAPVAAAPSGARETDEDVEFLHNFANALRRVAVHGRKRGGIFGPDCAEIQAPIFDRIGYRLAAVCQGIKAIESQRDDARAALATERATLDRLRDAGRVLADFAGTAPGRLPQRVQDAIAAIRAELAEGER